MKVRLGFLVFFGLLAAIPVFAQTRSVTNADLEKYKQKRLKAEKDYIDNYERMGFPSPAELQKQIERNRVEREALAARLTAERLQREQAEAERAALAAEAATRNEPNYYFFSGNQGSGFYGYPNSYYYGRGPRGRGFPRVRQYNPLINVGNGIPINGNNFYPVVRQPAIRMGRRP